MASSESLEESVAKEERTPTVTQVVEVVEDAAAEPSVEKTATIEELMSMRQAPTPSHEPDKEGESSTGGTGGKRRELVDELFKPKDKLIKEPSVSPEISVHTKRGIKPAIVWALITLAVAIGMGFVIISLARTSSVLPSIVKVPTPTPTPETTLTPTPTIASLARDAITIEVLNGGGTPGAASKMKTFLEEKGYAVGDIGNTEEYTYEQTEILVKANFADYLPILEKDLGESYIIGTSAATLEDNEPFDARVIVGKE